MKILFVSPLFTCEYYNIFIHPLFTKKILQFIYLFILQLIYIHSTKCVTDSIPHETPAINYWNSDMIKERDEFEFNNGGFGNLDLYEKDMNDKDSSENKVFFYL